MGALFRSEDMTLIQLFIQFESAHAVVNELGHLGMVQFRDLNPHINPFQRKFVGDIRRCEEMERKLRFLAKEIARANLELEDAHLMLDTSVDRSQQEAQELEEKLARLEGEIINMNRHEEALLKSFVELTELKYVLQTADKVFNESEGTESARRQVERGQHRMLEDDNVGLIGAGDIQLDNLRSGDFAAAGDSNRLGFLSGVIPRAKVHTFERVLWRALRGNLIMQSDEITEPIKEIGSDKPVEKNTFIVFVQGTTLQSKIRKLSESFGATLYPCPDSGSDRHALLQNVTSRLEDLTSVIDKTHEHRKRVLLAIAAQMDAATSLVLMEKSIFHTLNLFNFDIASKALVAEGWCPTKSLVDIQVALETAREKSQAVVSTVINVLKTHETPPTFHRTNKFTNGFQVIVDAYGIAQYQEVNPALFSIITFPFLFAIMFGDFGHGMLMTIVAAYIVIKEKDLKEVARGNEIFSMLYGGRYILLLMGIFSIYTGLIYNDIFSKSMEIFGKSGWEFERIPNVTLQEGQFTGHVYPIGVDPTWQGSDNLLIFSNSYKMKMSVIFGVVQMTFGIILSLYNMLFRKDWLSIINEFVPQMLFLQAIFGYLVVTIIYKWAQPWDVVPPPSLLNMLINMFLSPGYVKDGQQLYEGQGSLQLILVIIVVICVPWMLLVKPFVLRYYHNKKKSGPDYNHLHSVTVDHHDGDDVQITSMRNPASEGAADDEHHNGESVGGHGHAHGEHGEEFEFGEIFVHQTIHTIEFCLGCISNTASYLRLWALSLAHAQLAEVLWTMTLGQFYGTSGFIAALGLFAGFAGWFALTIFILLVMEGLSAFLHALRLHWVEFNNKFYKGDGYKFQPFSFAHLDNEDD